jgi:hypothetical protein
MYVRPASNLFCSAPSDKNRFCCPLVFLVQKFESLGKDGAYCCLMSREDVHMMPWIERLRYFRQMAYSERRDVPKLQQLYQRYGPLCAKFFPDELVF